MSNGSVYVVQWAVIETTFVLGNFYFFGAPDIVFLVTEFLNFVVQTKKFF